MLHFSVREAERLVFGEQCRLLLFYDNGSNSHGQCSILSAF